MRDRYKIISRRDETGKITHTYRGKVYYGCELIGYAPDNDDSIVIENRKGNRRIEQKFYRQNCNKYQRK